MGQHLFFILLDKSLTTFIEPKNVSGKKDGKKFWKKKCCKENLEIKFEKNVNEKLN